MSALVEQGVPGVVIFAGLLVWVVRSNFIVKRYRVTARDPKSDILMYAPALIAAAIVVFVAGVFTDYLKTEVQIWIYALLAASIEVHLPREQADISSTSRGPGRLPATDRGTQRSRFRPKSRSA
jgi:branched-subunit amino acid transport protein